MIAACRDPNHATSQALTNLSKGQGSSLIIAKCDSTIENDAVDLVGDLESKHGITHLDIVVPNAGISKAYPLVKDVTRPEILEHLEVNVFAVLSLYQATRELLRKSQAPNKPIFAPMGSGAGALGYANPTTSQPDAILCLR